MKLVLFFIIFLLLGYIIFSDKAAILGLIRPVQKIIPVSSPDYSHEDRKHLDSILEEVNP